MSGPVVSVIIPSYNRADLLPRAVDSVVSQSFADWEIVLVDDGSTDDTPAVARRYKGELGERFIHLHQPNGGSSGARNRGIDAARGRFVAFLDSDDEYLPGKLQRQLELFDVAPELGLVFSDYAYVDLNGVRHESAFASGSGVVQAMPSREAGPGMRICTEPLFDWLLREYFIATIVGMVRREVLGGEIRFATHLAYAEEWLFYLSVARRCRAGYVDEPLSLHHFLAGSLARTDKRRNSRRFLETLWAIRSEFDDLDVAQRRTLRQHVARAARQTGFDAGREGDWPAALRAFGQAWIEQPSLETTLSLAGSAIRCVSRFGSRGHAPKSSSQAASSAVR